MSDTVREKIQEITDSLYRTGVNDGKNRITYYPKPDETYFSVDHLLSIVREAVSEMIVPEDQDFIFKEESPSKNYNKAIDDVVKLLS